ncbi:hypothetical protein XELAEV_18001939mg [Xenopus laevis]|nr:hypothetical protein XELAEV_18001939mg [Xenopus laevis]
MSAVMCPIMAGRKKLGRWGPLMKSLPRVSRYLKVALGSTRKGSVISVIIIQDLFHIGLLESVHSQE